MIYVKKSMAFLMTALLFVVLACESTKTVGDSYPENEIPISSTSDEARQAFLEGLDIYDQGNGQKARPHFEKALELDPDFVSAKMYRVFTSNSSKDFAENRDQFLTMRDKANEGEAIIMDMVLNDMEDDDQKELELSKQLVEKYPYSARAYDFLANSNVSLNETEQARAHWSKALELNPNFLPAITSLGASYMFTTPKDLTKAQTYMEQAVEKKPKSSRAHINLGDCYRAENNLEKALASYQKAAEHDPQDPVAHSKAGHANSYLGNYDAARKNFQESRAVSEFGTNSYDFEAYTYLYEGDYKKALSFLEKAAATVDKMDIPDSNKTGTKMNCTQDCAMIAMHYGDSLHLKAVVEKMRPLATQTATDINSNTAKYRLQATMHYWDAIASVSSGDYDAAMVKAEMIKKTLATINDPNKLRPYHRALGFVNYNQGNYEKALEHMAKLDPDNPYMTYWKAKAHLMAGNTDKAMAMFEEISNYNFNFVGYALIRNEVKEILADAIK